MLQFIFNLLNQVTIALYRLLCIKIFNVIKIIQKASENKKQLNFSLCTCLNGW